MLYRLINPETILISQDTTLYPPVVSQKPQKKEPETGADTQKTNMLITSDGFVEKTFRIISKTVFFLDVGQEIPVDYTKEKVLENSIDLIPEKFTIFHDHIPFTDCIVGHAVNHRYISTTPEGIDSLFRIDNTTSPNLARHVHTGSANCSSVTLLAKFSQSHPKLKAKEFYELLGTEIDQSLVRFVAEQVKRYYEVSLVWAGADPDAVSQKLDYYASKEPKRFYQYIQKQEVNMDEFEKIKQFIKKHFNMECATLQQALDFIEQIKGENETIQQQVTDLENQVNTLKPFKETATSMLTALRNDVTRLQKLSTGTDLDELTKQVISLASYEKLIEMKKDLTEKAENSVPQKCQECGSTNVTRMSSRETLPALNPTQPLQNQLKKISFKIGCEK